MKARAIEFVTLIFLLMGCNNRVDLGYSPSNNESKETVEVSFSANFGDFDQLRTYPTGELEERKHRTTFKGLRVVFYSVDKIDPTQPDKVVYSFDKDLSATRGEFSGTDFGSVDLANAEGMGFKVKGSERISVDDYIVYVFATVSQDLKAATEVGQPFSALQKPMNFVDGEDIINNNLLYNHYVSEPITISKELFSDNAVHRIYSLPVAKMSAVNAMVSVTWMPTVQNTEMEIIDDKLQFYPDVQNKKYLLFPEYDENLQNTSKLLYPIDANYTGFATKSIEELSTDFFFRAKLSASDRHNSHLTDKVSNYRSLPENTLASGESKSNVVTRLVIRVRMIPKSLKEKLSAEQLADANLSWVNYLGTYYEASEFLALYNEAKAKSVKDSNDQKLIDIAERFIKDGNLPNIKSELGGYEDNEVRYYHSSFSYFTLPITHFTMEQLGGTIENGGYFGVVRNHHYKIDIKSFAGLGRTSYTYLSNDMDLLSERMVEQGQVMTDMEVVTNIIEVLY